MGSVSPFLEDVCEQLATEFRDKVVEELKLKCSTESDDLKKISLKSEIDKLNDFKASTGCFYKFMSRNKFRRCRPSGDAGSINDEDVEKQQQQLQRILCT